jgi:uncharacterized protein with GYD domain
MLTSKRGGPTMEWLVGIVTFVCILIVAHFTQRTVQELKETNRRLDRLVSDLENLMRGAEKYMNNRMSQG